MSDNDDLYHQEYEAHYENCTFREGSSCPDCRLLLAQEDPAAENYGHLSTCTAHKPQRNDGKPPLRQRDTNLAGSSPGVSYTETRAEALRKGYVKPDGTWLDDAATISAEYLAENKVRALICDEPTTEQATAIYNNPNGHYNNYGTQHTAQRWYWSEDTGKIATADGVGRCIFAQDDETAELELRARFDEPGETSITKVIKVENYAHGGTTGAAAGQQWQIMPCFIYKKTVGEKSNEEQYEEVKRLAQKVGRVQVDYHVINHLRNYQGRRNMIGNYESLTQDFVLQCQFMTVEYDPEKWKRSARAKKAKSENKSEKIPLFILQNIHSELLEAIRQGLLGAFKQYFTWRDGPKVNRDEYFALIPSQAKEIEKLRLEYLTEDKGGENSGASLEKNLRAAIPYFKFLAAGKDGFSKARPRLKWRQRYDQATRNYVREEIIYPDPTPEEVAAKAVKRAKLVEEQKAFVLWCKTQLRRIATRKTRREKAKAKTDGKSTEVGTQSGVGSVV